MELLDRSVPNWAGPAVSTTLPKNGCETIWMALGGSCSFCCWLDSSIISCMNRTPSSAATVLTAWMTRWFEMPAEGGDNQASLFKLLCLVYLWGVLDQLHSAIFQVDEADSHPPQQLQMFRVVCHEVLSPEGRAAHARLPEKRRNKKRRMLKIALGVGQ